MIRPTLAVTRTAFADQPLKPITPVSCIYPEASEFLSYPSPCLIVLAGASGIGKSTWGLRLFPEKSILSSDKMRLLLSGDESNMEISAQAFYLLHLMARQKLSQGQSVVVDSTALDPRARNDLVALAQHHKTSVHLILLEGSPELCFEGQTTRERKVPENVILDQLAASQELHRLIEARTMGQEGFSSALSLTREQAQAVKEARI